MDRVSPRRSVPLLVALRMILGGVGAQIGWLVFGFVMIFWWVFGVHSDFLEWYDFGGELDSAQGVVTSKKSMDLTVNDKPYYRYRYAFTSEGGHRREGVSFGPRGALGEDAAVEVEYPPGRPERSRIAGLHTSVMGIWGLLVLIPPMIALAVGLVSGLRGRGAVLLLETGRLTRGRLVDDKPTGMRINSRVVHKMTFEFDAEDGLTYTVSTRTHEPEKLTDGAATSAGEAPRYVDEEPTDGGPGGEGGRAVGEPVLYDPRNPARATVLDALPGSPRVDDDGRVRCTSVAGSIMAVILPTAAIIGHGTYAVIRLLV
jgi:hypothetical protein